MSTITQSDQRLREDQSPAEITETRVVTENQPGLQSADQAKQDDREVKEGKQVVAAGMVAEAVAGAAVIVLAIIGLAGIVPVYMLTIGTILLGVVLLLGAVAIAARYLTLLEETGGTAAGWELGAGEVAGFVGGLAGIILGILGLVGVFPVTLCAIAVIVAGGSLLVSTPSVVRLNRLVARRSIAHKNTQAFAYAVSWAGAGVQLLAGVAGIILGIVALTGIAAAILVLVSLICMGASLFLGGVALGARMLISAIG